MKCCRIACLLLLLSRACLGDLYITNNEAAIIPRGCSIVFVCGAVLPDLHYEWAINEIQYRNEGARRFYETLNGCSFGLRKKSLLFLNISQACDNVVFRLKVKSVDGSFDQAETKRLQVGTPLGAAGAIQVSLTHQVDFDNVYLNDADEAEDGTFSGVMQRFVESAWTSHTLSFPNCRSFSGVYQISIQKPEGETLSFNTSATTYRDSLTSSEFGRYVFLVSVPAARDLAVTVAEKDIPQPPCTSVNLLAHTNPNQQWLLEWPDCFNISTFHLTFRHNNLDIYEQKGDFPEGSNASLLLNTEGLSENEPVHLRLSYTLHTGDCDNDHDKDCIFTLSPYEISADSTIYEEASTAQVETTVTTKIFFAEAQQGDSGKIAGSVIAGVMVGAATLASAAVVIYVISKHRKEMRYITGTFLNALRCGVVVRYLKKFMHWSLDTGKNLPAGAREIE